MDKSLKNLHDLEQAFALIAENFPPLWWRIHQNCLDQGFDKTDSIRIVLTYIHGTCNGKLQLP